MTLTSFLMILMVFVAVMAFRYGPGLWRAIWNEPKLAGLFDETDASVHGIRHFETLDEAQKMGRVLSTQLSSGGITLKEVGDAEAASTEEAEAKARILA